MYLCEWGFHWAKGQKSYEEVVEEAKNEQRQPGQPELNAPESVRSRYRSRFTITNRSMLTMTRISMYAPQMMKSVA